jgi:hypothetical protein
MGEPQLLKRLVETATDTAMPESVLRTLATLRLDEIVRLSACGASGRSERLNRARRRMNTNHQALLRMGAVLMCVAMRLQQL